MVLGVGVDVAVFNGGGGDVGGCTCSIGLVLSNVRREVFFFLEREDLGMGEVAGGEVEFSSVIDWYFECTKTI